MPDEYYKVGEKYYIEEFNEVAVCTSFMLSGRIGTCCCEHKNIVEFELSNGSIMKAEGYDSLGLPIYVKWDDVVLLHRQKLAKDKGVA